MGSPFNGSPLTRIAGAHWNAQQYDGKTLCIAAEFAVPYATVHTTPHPTPCKRCTQSM